MTFSAPVKKKVEIIGNEIAVFTTHEDQASMHFEVSNFRFEHSDNSWRFPKTVETAETIWKNLPANYELSDDFRLLVSQKRVEIIGNEIAIFAPAAFQATADQEIYYSNNRALSRYEPQDESLRYPKTPENAETISEILAADYELSDDFRLLVNEFKQMKRIDLLPDEHLDRCVAVYYPQEPSPTIDPEFFWFRDKVDSGVYESSDNSWRFPLSAIKLLAIEFSSPAYHHSERFLREFDPIDCGF